MSFPKNRWVWFLLMAVLVGVLIFFWLKLQGPKVEAVEVKSFPLVRTLQFSARVATLSRVEVGSTLTGRVLAVKVREGALVEPGQLLVQLESDELRLALAQATATQQQVEARLAGLRSSGRDSVAAAVAQADATVAGARAEFKRTEQLVSQGFVSDSRLDEARRVLDVALAQKASAQAQIAAIGESGTDIIQAQAQVQLSRAAALAAQARLKQTTVTAPAAARVLSRAVEPGQIVQPGQALMSLAMSGPTQLIAQVDERFLDQLQVGQTAAVLADAFPGQRFSARVLSISPAVDPQRGAIEVKFALLQDPPAFLREDMTLSAEVETARRENTLVLPLSALRSVVSSARASQATATSQVFVVVDGKVQSRDVQLGLRTLEAVEVVQGLAPGDVVLLGNKTSLAVSVNQRVRVIRLPWQPSQSLAQAPREDAGAAMSNAMGR
jgi:HlyD family secretion protein